MPAPAPLLDFRVPGSRRRTPPPGLAVLLVVLAVVVSGCGLFGESGASDDPGLAPRPIDGASGSSNGVAPSGSAAPERPAAHLSRYYHQHLSWRSCHGGDRCATLRVPLDYAHPAKAIRLAVLKVPATHPASKVGSLVVNPGGPGGSGIDYAMRADSSFGAPVRSAYDIVGFDPRGVGKSTPLDCVSDSRLDRFVASDPDPDTKAEVSQTDRWLHQFGEGCLRRSGDLARHLSTVEVAKDVDVLRAALGDRKLSWFGASYGTFLGATYAGLFPGRVGRMVLDGAIDPSLSNEKLNLVQAHGFEVALRSYVKACVDRSSDCYLGSTVDEGIARIQHLLAQIERSPLPTGTSRQLKIGNAVLGVWAPLYNKNYWSYLDAGLRSAMSGDGSVLLQLSDAYSSRGPNGYTDNSFEVLYAVNCLDHDDSIPSSQVPSHFDEFEHASPTFGKIFAYGLSSCSTWPIHSGRKPAPIHAAGAAPIMVIGTTRDPATPLSWAQALARQLDSGVLVRRDGDGHTGYEAGNKCVDDTVNSYLVQGTVPDHTVDC